MIPAPTPPAPAFAHRAVMGARSAALQSIRSFFLADGFIEVETPVRLPAPAMELHIEAEPAGGAYLRTSPEFHMKRLLADGFERIFQVGPCFRKGERGRLHNPEFTLLEWYRCSADYMDMLNDARSLLARVASEVTGSDVLTFHGHRVDLTRPWAVYTVEDVFRQRAGWNPVTDYDADRFDMDLVEKVEPALPMDRPVVLKDYPREAAAFARCRSDDERVAERWELYAAGVELANAYSELADVAEQRRRFDICAQERRRRGLDVYPVDDAFMAALTAGLPPCGGVALGVDRLIMLLTGSETIDKVRTFT